MMTSDLLEQRIERLERSNDLLERQNQRLARTVRLLQRGGLIVALLAAVPLIIGGARRPEELKVVEAERFTMRSEDGKGRAELMMTPDGYPALFFIDENQKVRLALDLKRDGRPVLSMRDKEQKHRILMSASETTSSISLSHATNRSGIGLAVNSEVPILTFVDGTGKPDLRLDIDPKIGPLILFEGDKDRSMSISLPPE